MKPPTLILRLEGPRRTYRPGELLRGSCHWELPPQLQARRLELSVLWHTEGKGEEDFCVHYFEAYTPRSAGELVPPMEFSTRLPSAPWSYEGVIVKIYWCVRARLFLNTGEQVVQERLFRLGEVPRARPLSLPPLVAEAPTEQTEEM